MRNRSYHKVGLFIFAIALLVTLAFANESAGIWIIVAVLLSFGGLLLWSLIKQARYVYSKRSRKYHKKDSSLKLLAMFMGLLFVLGTLLYLYVFLTMAHDEGLAENERHEFSNVEYLLRSLICSLDLFMLDVDSNLLDTLKRHSALKGWLSFQAVVSFACTITVLVGLVYSRLHAYYHLHYKTKIKDETNHLYLFFGNNAQSTLLIKDIIKNDPKSIPIIIDKANIEEEENDEWEGIVGLIAHKQKIFRVANAIGAQVAIASQNLAEIDDDIVRDEDFDAFEHLGLHKVKKLVKQLGSTASPQLHIFFLDNDEDSNIRNILVLSKDCTMMNVAADDKLQHCIYCHARYNGPNRVIEDVALRKRLQIKIIDSSHLAVELLKLDPTAHPVNVVKLSQSNPTTISLPFKAMIIGFGEVGRDAFRFLYEFGAFVDEHTGETRSQFECRVVDKEMDNIAGTLKSAMPGIFSASGTQGKEVSISFESMNYNSQAFFEDVFDDKFAADVNYIIIALKDSEESIALATRIFRKIRRVRDNLSNLRIYVRCTDNSKLETIQKIADHYNFGYAQHEKNIPIINIFGHPEKIYTYALIIGDQLVEKGKLFQSRYRKLSGEGKSWDERHSELVSTATPDIDKLRKLRRQESQDKANALHAATKLFLFNQAINSLCEKRGQTFDLSCFLIRYFNADGTAKWQGRHTEIHNSDLSEEENAIIRNLAILEHVRWNAAHELMGYVFYSDGNKCDERTMRHNCLCPWSQLDVQSQNASTPGWQCDYKRYDYCVVDVTISQIVSR